MPDASSTRARNAGLAILAVFFVAACGDARLSTSGDPPGFDDRRPTRDDDPTVPSTDAGDDAFTPDDPFRPPPTDLRCVLIPSVGGEIFVGVESAVQIGAYQFSIETGEPMPEERLTFLILEDESVPARLSAEAVSTNDDGLGAVRLSAGADPGEVVVRVFSPCANSIDIRVDVLELPTGNLQVAFNYPFRDLLDVAPVEVRMFMADDFRCRDLRAGEVPAGEVLSGSAPNTTGTVPFNGLRADLEFTVLAVGRGPNGERAASGCADGVFVRDGRNTELTIDLFLIPLDPVGDYDVLSHWDFRNAIAESGEVGRLIVEVLDVFDDPGRGIVNFIMRLVRDLVGGIISVAIDLFLSVTGLDRVISDAINDLIESSPFLSDVVTIGRDLRAIIAELEVISKLNIGKLGSDYEVFGSDRWTGLALYWRLGCSPTDPPDCGRVPLELDTLDLGLLRGDWTGRVVGYERLDIDRHPVDFEYGRLILHVLEYIVLPAITGTPGPVTLADLMASIINCRGIGAAVAGGEGRCRCAFGACICADDVEGICRDFINLTFGFLFRGFVEALSFDAVLDIRGTCRLVNLDDQVGVDALEDGEYVGNIYITETPTPFTADFCGVNVDSGLEVTDHCLEGRRR